MMLGNPDRGNRLRIDLKFKITGDWYLKLEKLFCEDKDECRLM